LAHFFDKKPLEFVESAESELKDVFKRFEAIGLNNQMKVLDAFHHEKVAPRHFMPTSGYGYDDIGRDTLERVFARVFGAEDALVRPQIVSGTHAIAIALFGALMPGDTLLSATGKPYDTLESAIGISGDAHGSLTAYGVNYKQVELLSDGNIDAETVVSASVGAKVVYFQRSRGYAWRNAVTIDMLRPVFARIHEINPKTVIIVDNCYAEFTDIIEPTQIGADIIVGSLIKNPGGGLAPTGGYIVGTSVCISLIENRLTSPGIGREVGSYAGSYTPFYQGLFLAPHVTIQALKSAALFARVFERIGMETLPSSTAQRADIVQSLRFGSADELIGFCRSIQSVSPIDSHVVPEPWDMPGYQHKVIMAAGTFVQGASIELSADAPIKAPYTAYIQGALTYEHGKIAVINALDALEKAGLINIPG
jgi:cystathionine beta-lyase family protein involved in aluminum resistance